MNRKQKRILIRIIISTVLTIGLKILFCFTALPKAVPPAAFLVPYLLVGYDILRKALKGILNRQVFDENFLMAVATIGAMLLGEYEEGVAVIIFYQIGELFQSYAVGKSRRNISELMDIRPDYANIERDGEIQKTDPDEVKPGTIIIVRPGEKIPIDGIVREGKSSLNTSALTGESVPKSVRVGDSVVSGCINIEGLLRIETTKEFGESTVSKILELMEESSQRKARSEKFISRFSKYYTPAVCIGALVLALVPSVVGYLCFGDSQFSVWFYRALTFLVISCPCALVISIPLSFFAGIGGAGKEGILIKGSNFLEELSRVKYVAFDKTGTVTKGVFDVTRICSFKLPETELKRLAAHAESMSTHPIALSIVKNYDGEILKDSVRNIQETSGQGIKAFVDGLEVAIGNGRLMESEGIEYVGTDQTGTIVHMAVEGEYAGYMIISDIIKDTAKDAVAELKAVGVKKAIMLTGDGKETAESVAASLNMDEVYSMLMPDEKVKRIEEILSKEIKGERTAFVGDGINDAPVLARADIGIAMGALGSDAAIEAADVVLMDDDPVKLSEAIGIAKKTMRIVYENIYFAIGIKLLCLVLGAVGIADMWLAIFADVGVMIIAVLNAIRALNTKRD